MKAVEAFLDAPSIAVAARLRDVFAEARRAAQAVRGQGTGGRAVEFSAALDSMAAEAKSVVEEMLLFEVPVDKRLRAAAAAAREASGELAAAVDRLPSDGAACSARLLEARRKAKAVERAAKDAAGASLREANAVEAMKLRSVARRFSAVADWADRAAETLGDIAVSAA